MYTTIALNRSYCWLLCLYPELAKEQERQLWSTNHARTVKKAFSVKANGKNENAYDNVFPHNICSS